MDEKFFGDEIRLEATAAGSMLALIGRAIDAFAGAAGGEPVALEALPEEGRRRLTAAVEVVPCSVVLRLAARGVEIRRGGRLDAEPLLVWSA